MTMTITIEIEDAERVLEAYASAYAWTQETPEAPHIELLKEVLLNTIRSQVQQIEQSRVIEAALKAYEPQPLILR